MMARRNLDAMEVLEEIPVVSVTVLLSVHYVWSLLISSWLV